MSVPLLVRLEQSQNKVPQRKTHPNESGRVPRLLEKATPRALLKASCPVSQGWLHLPLRWSSQEIYGSGSKIGTQNETMVNGTKDKNLRFSGGLILTHSHIKSNNSQGRQPCAAVADACQVSKFRTATKTPE